jgi:hypothetical protein
VYSCERSVSLVEDELVASFPDGRPERKSPRIPVFANLAKGAFGSGEGEEGAISPMSLGSARKDVGACVGHGRWVFLSMSHCSRA